MKRSRKKCNRRQNLTGVSREGKTSVLTKSKKYIRVEKYADLYMRVSREALFIPIFFYYKWIKFKISDSYEYLTFFTSDSKFQNTV